MYLVRNVFTTKPGKAKELVDKFKAAGPGLEEMGIRNTRILTDAVAGFWTVVVEAEVGSLDEYFETLRSPQRSSRLGEAMAGYIDLVAGGHREILRVE